MDGKDIERGDRRMRELTQKDVVIAINSGNGLKDLEENFGLSRENLESKIQAMYGGNTKSASRVLRDLKKNDKNQKKTKKKVEPVEPIIEPATKPVIETIVDTAVKSATEEHTLAKLKRHEENLRNQVIILEKEHAELLSTRKDEEVIQARLKDKLVKYYEQFKATNSELSQSVEKMEAISTQIAQVNTKVAKVKSKLDETRAEIETAQRIEIYVMKDGKIEISPNKTIEPGEDITVEMLKLGKKYKTLTVVDLQTLYCVINLVHRYKDSGYKTEIIFDNIEMEVAFNDFKLQS